MQFVKTQALMSNPYPYFNTFHISSMQHYKEHFINPQRGKYHYYTVWYTDISTYKENMYMQSLRSEYDVLDRCSDHLGIRYLAQRHFGIAWHLSCCPKLSFQFFWSTTGIPTEPSDLQTELLPQPRV